MSNHEIVFLNIIALLALLLVLAPLIWAAIQDGRYDATHHRL
jgi:hypothetical protein